jgi:autotransporter-associated beta strand protein
VTAAAATRKLAKTPTMQKSHDQDSTTPTRRSPAASADSGPPSGSGGSLTKIGTGTLVLSGTNTYGGGTFVTGGELVVTSAGGIESDTALNVGNDLAEFGTVVPGEVAAQPSMPVPEPGTLTLFTTVVCGAAVFQCLRIRRKKQ